MVILHGKFHGIFYLLNKPWRMNREEWTVKNEPWRMGKINFFKKFVKTQNTSERGRDEGGNSILFSIYDSQLCARQFEMPRSMIAVHIWRIKLAPSSKHLYFARKNIFNINMLFLKRYFNGENWKCILVLLL